MKTAALVAAVCIGIYLLLCLLVYLFQDRMLFFPFETLVADPGEIGLRYEDVAFESDEGVSIHGWYVPAADSSRTLLFFHGNAGNISHRLESIRQFNRLGLSTLIIDYRGYGRSTGSPDEDGLYRDADAAWSYLTKTRGIPASSIILFGRSLGGAVAASLAERHRPGGLILESTFTSVPDRGSELYPFLPVRLLSRLQFNTLERMSALRTPLLVVHSPDDEIVPFNHGRKLFEAAPEPKRFLQITGGHNDGFLVSGPAYERGLADFLSTLE